MIYSCIIERKARAEFAATLGGYNVAAVVYEETEDEFLNGIAAGFEETGDFLIGVQYLTDSRGRINRAIITAKGDTAKIVENK